MHTIPNIHEFAQQLNGNIYAGVLVAGPWVGGYVYIINIVWTYLDEIDSQQAIQIRFRIQGMSNDVVDFQVHDTWPEACPTHRPPPYPPFA